MPFGQSTGQGFVNPGVVVATTVIVEGAKGGVFIYSPSPGPGNLIGSWAAQAGVDAFGNAYPQGLAIFNDLLTIEDPGTIEFVAGSTVTGSIKSNTSVDSLHIDAPNNFSLTGGDVILEALHHIYAGSDATATAPLGWQVIPAPNFQNGWGGVFKWRYGAENEIKFQAGLNAPGAGGSVDGTVICNLFGITVPAVQSHAVATNAIRTGGAGQEGPALQLQTNGNVTCFGIAAAATTVFGCGFWPLDN